MESVFNQTIIRSLCDLICESNKLQFFNLFRERERKKKKNEIIYNYIFIYSYTFIHQMNYYDGYR